MDADIFFDFDMTLGYRILMWTATVRELLLERCVVPEEGAVRPFYVDNGYPWNRPDLSHEEFFKGKQWWQNSQDFIVEGLMQNKVCDLATAKSVADAFPSRFADIRYWRLFPDTVPTLELLKERGFNLHVLSNHVPEARQIITQLGIADYFSTMILSAEVGWEKPNARIYQLAAKGTKGLKIMIGDNYDCDVDGAIKNGFQPILVRKPNYLRYKNYCADFKCLPTMIDKLAKEYYENR